MADQRVALITGGNAGIGLTVAERLLSLYKDLQLCLACRNQVRAETARRALQLSHPEANISIVIMDTSSVKSVLDAAKKIKKRYTRLDFLYLNAGIMPVSKINIDHFCKGFFSKNCVYMLTTGHGLLQQTDEDTSEGLKKIFATNLFGHFVLIQELMNMCILGGDKSSQIVWTSSNAAAPRLFNIDDIQHTQSIDPYGVSKHTTDILSVSLNEKLNNKGIYSHTTCPGLVMSNLTYGILPYWCWMILLPFFFLMRLFVGSLNYSSYNGSEALVWLPSQRPETLDPRTKYCSQTNILGQCYIKNVKLKVTPEEADGVYKKLNDLYKDFKNSKYCDSDVANNSKH